MPPSDAATKSTPLAPSVEKAYYRKCIELKRRLNEVEAANDEAKIRRTRLDRGIMKIRLERAFLLDELRKRMDHNVDDSEGSGEDNTTTPPADRPHRDKRRRPDPPMQPPGPTMSGQQQMAGLPRQASDPQRMGQEYSHPDAVPPQAYQASGAAYYPTADQPQHGMHPQTSYQQNGPYGGGPPTGLPTAPPNGGRRTNGAEDGGAAPVNRHGAAAGEPIGAGPVVQEGVNGEGGFTAVNVGS